MHPQRVRAARTRGRPVHITNGLFSKRGGGGGQQGSGRRASFPDGTEFAPIVIVRGDLVPSWEGKSN